MREQKENNLVWFIAILAMFVIVALRCFEGGSVYDSDATFLYNRCWQMWDCVKHGYYPFLYYNDIGGIGYGSPIFYGQLTLILFIPFLGSFSGFMNAYFAVSVVVNFFGFRAFCKRFSSYATLSACFYIVGVPFVMIAGVGLYAFVFALGISWYFLAFCVDYFRDSRSLPFLILTYFLTWQSNLQATMFTTLACFVLFIVYFDSSRFWSYMKLFLYVLALVSFNLVNMYVHRDAVRFVDITSWMQGDTSTARVVFSLFPFGGFILRGVLSDYPWGDLCCGAMQIGILVVFVRYLITGFGKESHRFKVVSFGVLAVCVIGYFVGTRPIWGSVYEVTHIVFQFPIRYFIFLYGFLIVILSRVIRAGKLSIIVLFLCIMDILIANPLVVGTTRDELPYVFQCIAFGEYAGSSFPDEMLYNTDLYKTYAENINSLSGTEYSWQNEYNGVTVDCSLNVEGDTLTLPKLYYKGYQAIGENGERFVVKSGYSNYCEVDIGDYTGVLSLSYQVPVAILTLFWVQIACVLGLLYDILRSCLVHARAEGK